MPHKKKKFIDKKNSVTFHLVHRSQKDPLQADSEAPERVLLPVDESHVQEIRQSEQRKYGIDFDDDYDYLQHLKDTHELNEVGPGVEVYRVESSKKQKPKVHFDSELFGSTVETDVGMLNKAAPVSGPQPDWDPDIVAALDEDFDFDNPDNLLDDDFMSKANSESFVPNDDVAEEKIEPSGEQDIWADFRAYKKDLEDNYKSDEESGEFSGSNSDLGSLEEFETKTKFTNYSMSSSVIRRNEGLTLLDDRFEHLFSGYDDNEIGAIEHEDIEGNVHQNSDVLNQIVNEFEDQHKEITLKDAIIKQLRDDVNDSSESESENIAVIEPPKEKWDCESILSTYSNLYNHPKQIVEPRSNKSRSKRTSINSESIETESVPLVKANTLRPKDETTEERKARKQQIKQERKIRREQKKGHKDAFKSEEMRIRKDEMNQRQNMQGIKL